MMFSIGPFHFPSKEKVRSHAQELLHKYPEREPLINLDDEFLRSLVNLHPHAAAKIGVGISHFTIETAGKWGQRYFVLHRLDRTTTDFSYLSCFNPPTHRAKVFAALRDSVVDQIFAFRKRILNRGRPITCAYTG